MNQKIDFQEKHDDFSRLVNDMLNGLVTGRKPNSVYAPFDYIISGKGKRIRPVLTMAACGAAGGRPEEALEAACALEVLHNYTLVHDDIMDRSPLRRGRETVHIKWDEATAILSGDLMSAFAYRMLEKYRSHPGYPAIVSCFTTAFVEVCEGQGLDMDFEKETALSMDMYLEMIRKKTSELLVGAVKIGGSVASAPDGIIDALGKFAHNLGIAFQIQDDLLDLVADEARLGKRIGNDIIEGKKTYLVIKASEKVRDREDVELFGRFMAEHGLPEEYIPRMRALFEKLGVLEDAQADIDRCFGEASEALAPLGSNQYVDMLKWMISKLNKRNF